MSKEELRQNRLKLLAEWEGAIIQVEENVDELTRIIGCQPDSPLMESINILVDKYTDRVAEKVGDTAEWLDWYRFETLFGFKPMKASLGEGHPEVEISDVEDLLPFLDSTDEQELQAKLDTYRGLNRELMVKVRRLEKEVAHLRSQVDSASG